VRAGSRALPPHALLAGLVVAWEAAVRLAGVERYLLPAPSDIGRALVEERSRLADDTAATLGEMLLGFALALAAGVGIAVLLHRFATLRGAAMPLLIASQSVPLVAIAPVLVVYLGFGLLPKLLMVAIVCVFPIAIGTIDGLASVDPGLLRAMRTLHAGRLDLFRRVELPWSLPRLFSGARVAAAYAAVAAMFAEYAGASEGLGLAMREGLETLDSALTGAAVVLLSALALALVGAVRLVERRVVPWAHEGG
jgi:putative hydroxymethylpyrimidine transport system permease protein